MKKLFLVHSVAFLWIYPAIAQNKINFSLFASPVLCVLNELEVGKEFSNYRNDIYDYRNISKGSQLGVSGELKIAEKYFFTGTVALSDERYVFSTVVHDYISGTSSKFIIKNMSTFIMSEFGVKRIVSDNKKWALHASVGYKTLIGSGGGVLQLDNLYNTGSSPTRFSYFSSSSPQSGGFGYMSFGVSRQSDNNRFTYGLHYQRALGYYPQMNLTTALNSVVVDGWSAPKVHCFSFRVSYNLGIKKK